MSFEYVLYCDSPAILAGLEQNREILSVLRNIEDYRRKGIDLRVVDSGKLSADEIQASYIRAIQPSVRKKYAVRQMFGSRGNSGWLFARGVPALVIQDRAANAPEDVFPHRESGRIITICDALNRVNRP